MHYKDKNWLECQYATKSTGEIAKDEGVDPETIRRWLKTFGVARRNPSHYLTVSPELIDFMNGSMLGDGSVSWGQPQVSAYYSISSSYRDYLEWLEKKLNVMGIELRGKIYIAHRGKYQWWHMHSRYYRGALEQFRSEWYPGGKKMVPPDIELSPNSLRLFYMDDGSLSITPTQKQICIAMNSFTIEATQNIKNKICCLIGDDKIYARDSGSGPCIWISKKSVIKDFFDFIGECPQELEEVFGYKWL
jgi:hypothetical protein